MYTRLQLQLVKMELCVPVNECVLNPGTHVVRTGILMIFPDFIQNFDFSCCHLAHCHPWHHQLSHFRTLAERQNRLHFSITFILHRVVEAVLQFRCGQVQLHMQVVFLLPGPVC